MSNPLHAVSAFLFRRRLRGAVRFHTVVCGGSLLGVRTKHGVRLRLDPYEYVSERIIRNGYYEEEVLNAITEDLRSTDVFWDIGAFLGIHALTIAKRHPSVKVAAFEPNPAMAARVRSAIEENGVAVSLQPLALGASDGSSEFYVDKGNLGSSSLVYWDRRLDFEKITVSVATADSLVSGGRLPAPNVVKIDVEGGECDVLKGMSGLLRGRDLRRVVFEDARDEKTGAKTLLSEAGFSIRQLTRLEDTHHDLENYVAVRPAN